MFSPAAAALPAAASKDLAPVLLLLLATSAGPWQNLLCLNPAASAAVRALMLHAAADWRYLAW
jgi:hypothetical protein